MKARTMFCVAVFIIAGFGLLIYQLYALQLRDAELYRTEAVTQQMKDITLPALRGSIYSVNGKLLAKSNTVWNIVADPSSIAKSGATEAQLRTAAQGLADLLGDGTTADTVYEILTAKNASGTPYQYRMLAKGVEKPVADAIVSYADTYRMEPEKNGATGKRILYLSTEQASTRSYPYGEFLASVLGFCNSDGEGAYGLEKYYNETLAGTPGRSVAETDVNGNALASGQSDLHEAIDGNDLYLTIDENVQAIVEQYLTEAMNTFTVHGRGSAIVMNVKTGAILAMASIEQFDPNDPYKITDAKMTTILDKEEIDAEDIDWLEGRLGEKAVKDIIADGKISRDKTVDEDGNEVASEYTQLQGMMREAQWKNKNITELYMPGSVFKLITASAGLDSGIMSTSQTFYCGGSLTVNEGSELWEHTYRCANGEVHYEQDMAGALNHSCNLWFIQAAETLKPQIFYDYIQAFGFTQPTGIDLPNETRWTSVYNAEQMAEVDTNLYTAAFGQNESITPMQMATAVAAIANGGYLVTPYVVDSVTDKDGNIVTQTETSIRRQVISEEVSRQLLSMMENNVHGEGNYHSCANAYVAGYRIGGKSGTAERTDRHLRGDGDYYKAMSFSAVLPQIQVLTARGWEILPILSASAAGLDTRFGTAAALRQTLLKLTGHEPLTTLQGVEPLGPQKLADALIIAPATGTTMALLAAGISATPVTLAAKSLLRGGRPVILAPSTNDGLAGSAPALGQLLQRRSYYFVPFGQDDCYKKPRSLKSDFTLLPDTLDAALRGVQLQPMLV